MQGQQTDRRVAPPQFFGDGREGIDVTPSAFHAAATCFEIFKDMVKNMD